MQNDHIVALTYEQDGKKIREEADVFISSMPIRDLVGGMNDVPEKEPKLRQDFLTVITAHWAFWCASSI